MKHSQFIWVEDNNGHQNQEEFQPWIPARQSRKLKTNKTEFVGWGSKQLFGFLASIGVDTADKLSQHDVTGIIYKYINANNLINPNKKKRVVCDERLKLLFGRKTVGRIKISDLLERHLAENQEETASEGDELLYSSDEDASVTPKRKAISSAEKKSPKKTRQAPPSNDSCFAEVIPENIKLVYLRKSLVQVLSKDTDTFDNKIAGTFVRIKPDPNDFTQKNYFQLVRVIGIKRPAGTDALNKQILLQVSNSIKDISISLLSDDDFSKEECEDVKRRIKEGLLGRLTVVELEQKAQTLHQDITKHWIETELVLLQRLVDRANEKGWRREVFTLTDYLDRRQLLQTPSEQTRLLQELPKIIAEKIVPTLPQETTPEQEPEPKARIITEPAEKKYSGDVSDDEDGWLESIIKAAEDARAQSSTANGTTTPAHPAPAFKIEFPAAEDQSQAVTDEGDGLTPAKSSGDDGFRVTMHNISITKSAEIPAESPNSVSFPNNKSAIPNPNLSVGVEDESGSVDNPAESLKIITPLSKLDSKLSRPFPYLTVEVKDLAAVENAESVAENPKKEMTVSKRNEKVGAPQVIELSDDDDGVTSSLICDQPERPLWEYLDPQGTVQGPFSLLTMKRWADADYFPSGFLVWKTHSPHIKFALAEVLHQSFSNHRR